MQGTVQCYLLLLATIMAATPAAISVASAADADDRNIKIDRHVLDWMDEHDQAAQATPAGINGTDIPTLSVYLYLDSEESINDLPDYVTPVASSYNIVVAFLTAAQITDVSMLDIVTRITLPDMASPKDADPDPAVAPATAPEIVPADPGTGGGLPSAAELADLDARLQSLEAGIASISNSTMSLSSTILYLAEQLALLEELLADIEAFMAPDIHPAMQEAGLGHFTNSMHDDSYIEVLNPRDSYSEGDIITIRLYIDESTSARPAYGLFLTAGPPGGAGDLRDAVIMQAGHTRAPAAHAASVIHGIEDNFYGPGFYCSNTDSSLDLKFERTGDLTASSYNGWSADPGRQGVPCPVDTGMVHTIHFSITGDYPVRDDYAFVAASGPGAGFATGTFSVT